MVGVYKVFILFYCYISGGGDDLCVGSVCGG